MKFIVFRQSLDRENPFTGCLNRQNSARIHRTSVEDNGAAATFSPITTHLGPGQPQLFAQELRQRQANIDVGFNLFPVDQKRNMFFIIRHRLCLAPHVWATTIRDEDELGPSALRGGRANSSNFSQLLINLRMLSPLDQGVIDSIPRMTVF